MTKLNRKQNQKVNTAIVKKQLATAFYDGLKDGMCVQVTHSLVLKPVIIRAKYVKGGTK